MNVKESCELNVLLYYVLGLDRPGMGPVRPEDARAAAVALADKSNRTLMAGLDGHRVERAWDDYIARRSPMKGKKPRGKPSRPS